MGQARRNGPGLPTGTVTLLRDSPPCFTSRCRWKKHLGMLTDYPYLQSIGASPKEGP